MKKQQTTPTRPQVNKKDTWDLTAIYKSPSAWDRDYIKTTRSLNKLKRFSGKLKNKKNILACLCLFYELDKNVARLYIYAHLTEDVDLANAASARRMGKTRNLMTRLEEVSAFIDPEMSALDITFLRTLLKNTNFKDYHYYLKRLIRGKKHILSTPEENILAQCSEIFTGAARIFRKMSDVDIKFEPVSVAGKEQELNHATYSRWLEDKNRSARKQAAENMNAPYNQFRNTLAESLNAHVKTNVQLARVRKHGGVIASFLHDKAVPKEVYKTLFRVANRFLPLLHRYTRLRKKVLKLKNLNWYDLYVPLVDNVKSNYSYNEAVAMVLESLAPLGEDYKKAAEAGLTILRWVDKFPNRGKRSGAYSSGSYDTYPYIMMNYNNTIHSVFTLTHELGHSMHTYLDNKAQPYPLSDYPILLAEIASTTNEVLLAQHLLKNADKKMRLYIINQELEDIRMTFFRQTMFAEFEAKLYEHVDAGEILTADFLEDEYYRLNQRYYGPDIIINDYIKHEWSRIPHFYFNFYVYQYATGLSAANFFSELVLNGAEKDRDHYLAFLAAGGSDFPLNLLKKAGLDITQPHYLNALMKKFASLLNEFESLSK